MRKAKLAFVLLTLLCAQWGMAQCGSDPAPGLTTISAAGQIVNSYFPGTGSPVAGATSVNFGTIDGRGSATTLAAGDLIVIMQMQGADIDASNSDAYGNGVAGGAASGYLSSNLYAGNFEYNTVTSVAGSTINLLTPLANNYYTQAFSASTPIRNFQIIRVPRYSSLTINAGASVTAPAWNGTTGGVVIIDAASVFTLNGTVSVAALGFRGGGGKNFTGATPGSSNGSGALTNTDYRWNSPLVIPENATGGSKGEGIAGTPNYILATGDVLTTSLGVEGYINGSLGRGAAGNAGGGATDGGPFSNNQYNPGGGGGGNAGAGGQGGSGWHGGSGDVNTYPTGGYGGSAFPEGRVNRIIMGGGGGAGAANNSTLSNEYQSSGASGGGIIITRAASYAGTGSLVADGGDAVGAAGVGGTSNSDGAGGGGAGGTIVAVTRANVTTGLNTIAASAKGGTGGYATNYYDHGPGGGGGGGYVFSNGTFATVTVTGGANGLTRTGSDTGPINNAYGATAGGNGSFIIQGNAPPLVPSPCGILPISILGFNGSVKNSNVLLNWQVDGAVSFNRFEVEYSLNGASFTKVNSTDYVAGQTNYTFTHANVTASVVYYRLKLVDVSGSFAYSKTITIRISREKGNVLIFPNPAKDRATLQFGYAGSATATLTVVDQSGRVLNQKTFTVQNGDNFVPIETEAMSNGTYVVRVYINNELFVVQKLQVAKTK